MGNVLDIVINLCDLGCPPKALAIFIDAYRERNLEVDKLVCGFVLDLIEAGAPSRAIKVALTGVAQCRAEVAEIRGREAERKRVRRACEGAGSDDWGRLRGIVFRRDNWACVYCGAITYDLHCDHVIPVTRGGKTELSNLATACASCNLEKGGRLVDEWIKPAVGLAE